MSCLLMRPPAPVPGMVARSMPRSLAMRRTSGELWMRSPAGREGTGPGPEAAAEAGAAAAGLGACAGGTICGFAAGAGAAGLAGSATFDAGIGAGAALAAAAPSPAASITPTTVWIGTVLPSPTLISFSTPAEGEGISASTLSVEISNSGSWRSTLSPGFLSHLVMVHALQKLLRQWEARSRTDHRVNPATRTHRCLCIAVDPLLYFAGRETR